MLGVRRLLAAIADQKAGASFGSTRLTKECQLHGADEIAWTPPYWTLDIVKRWMVKASRLQPIPLQYDPNHLTQRKHTLLTKGHWHARDGYNRQLRPAAALQSRAFRISQKSLFLRQYLDSTAFAKYSGTHACLER